MQENLSSLPPIKFPVRKEPTNHFQELGCAAHTVDLSLMLYPICSLLLGGFTLSQSWNDCVHAFTSKPLGQSFCVCTSLCKNLAIFLLRLSVPRPCGNKVPATLALNKVSSIKDSKTWG